MQTAVEDLIYKIPGS